MFTRAVKTDAKLRLALAGPPGSAERRSPLFRLLMRWPMGRAWR